MKSAVKKMRRLQRLLQYGTTWGRELNSLERERDEGKISISSDSCLSSLSLSLPVATSGRPTSLSQTAPSPAPFTLLTPPHSHLLSPPPPLSVARAAGDTWLIIVWAVEGLRIAEVATEMPPIIGESSHGRGGPGPSSGASWRPWSEDEDAVEDKAGEFSHFNWFFRKMLLTIHFISSFERRRGGGRTTNTGGDGWERTGPTRRTRTWRMTRRVSCLILIGFSEKYYSPFILSPRLNAGGAGEDNERRRRRVG